MTADTQENPPGAARTPSAGRKRAVVETALVFLVFFTAAGDPPPGVNEAHYLCRLKHFANPDWCRGDLFLESPDAHLAMVLMGAWAVHWLPLAALAWVGRLLVWGLLAVAWRRLSSGVATALWCAPLSAALWVTGVEQLHLAGEWVVGGVEAKCFAYVFVLLGLAEYAGGHWNRAWLLLGVASALHPLVGGWSVLVLFALWAIYHRREATFWSMLPCLAAGGVLALAGVAPPLLMNWGVDPGVVADANRIYVFDRLPHHLALLSMPDAWLANRAVRNLIMLLLLAAATLTAMAMRRRAWDPRRPDALMRLVRFAWGAAVLVGLGLAIEFSLSDAPAAAARWLRYYWFRLNDVAAPLAVSLVAVAGVAAGVRARRAWAPALLALLILAPAWHLGSKVWQRQELPIPPADRKVHNYANWVDACRWAAENTSEDALFLVPRYSHTFKWRAGRAVVVTYKDIPQDAAGLVEWRRRLYDIYTYPHAAGGDDPHWIVSLSELGARRLRELADKYGADYVLTDRYRRASLPVAYANATYVIYDLRGAQ